ncbi:hypothetical protein QYM36_014219 [Artemia franciscana]|uniref:Uncharacterized protein n=2 Tax=Artemia franciscana TaxID=6661 RepID=A0AA88KXV1_ARTSF|nr:hypothetical protein QYM36_014219 [Artemia franciscana]
MDQESEDMLEKGASVFTQELLMKTQQARQTFADIEACHDDVMNFMRESHEMFMEMAMLVVWQEEMIQGIVCNVEHAQDDGSDDGSDDAQEDGSDDVQTATQNTIIIT